MSEKLDELLDNVIDEIRHDKTHPEPKQVSREKVREWMERLSEDYTPDDVLVWEVDKIIDEMRAALGEGEDGTK